jgi:hypothetical protein
LILEGRRFFARNCGTTIVTGRVASETSFELGSTTFSIPVSESSEIFGPVVAIAAALVAQGYAECSCDTVSKD